MIHDVNSVYERRPRDFERHAAAGACNALDHRPDKSAGMVELARAGVGDRAALRELRRVVRLGGHLVVSIDHPLGDWRRHGGGYFVTEVFPESFEKLSQRPDFTMFRLLRAPADA